MSANGKSSGLAIASLVLGILSVVLAMCFGFVAAIPAIIMGHIAYTRARKEPERYSGAGLAIAGFVTGYVGLAFSLLILPAMLLPALAKAKAKAQRISCVNNLKQVGLSHRQWAMDHGDSYPCNVPGSQGGTLEFCEAGPDGFDLNAWRHLQVLSNELFTPKILVCPADDSKTEAISFRNLGPQNVTYQVRSGPAIDESNPREVLARCELHNNELMCDGSVFQQPLAGQ
jgi:hypothetical protein